MEGELGHNRYMGREDRRYALSATILSPRQRRCARERAVAAFQGPVRKPRGWAAS